MSKKWHDHTNKRSRHFLLLGLCKKCGSASEFIQLIKKIGLPISESQISWFEKDLIEPEVHKTIKLMNGLVTKNGDLILIDTTVFSPN